MELLFEFIFNLVFEGVLEASQSSKIPKVIRYPLVGLVVLFFIAVIGLIFLTGILMLKEVLLAGIFFLLIGLVMLVFSVKKFRELYLKRNE